MRIAVPDLISPSYFPAIAAVELGLCRDEGVDAEIELLFPVPKTMEALRDGSVDFVAGSAHAALMAFPEWKGAKLLMALAQRMYWFLVLRSNLGAKKGDVQAVKGLRIGAAAGVDLGLKRLLVEAGVDLERDAVQISPVPGAIGPGISFGLAAAKALEEGRVDGFWANGMGAEIAVRRGVGTVVLDVRRGDGPPACRYYTFPALITTERKIIEDPDGVAAVTRAVMKAQRVLKSDPSRATDAARRRFPLTEAGLIAELIQRDLPYYDPLISEVVFAKMNDFARDVGLLKGQASYEQVVATIVGT